MMKEANMTRRSMLTSLGMAGAANIVITGYGAVPGGTQDVSAAIQNAIDDAKGSLTGAVRIPKGRWKAKNLVVENCTLAFDDGATLVFELGARDNGLLLRSNVRIYNATFEVTNSAPPPDGNFGNVFRIGDYEAVPEETYSHIRVQGAKVICGNAGRVAQAVEVLGQVNDFILEDMTFYGPFDAGIIVHWGGDVGGTDAHNQFVTYSCHPHDGVIRNIRFLPRDGKTGNYGIILSAVYDITIDNVVSDSWACPLRILPGDVYAQVAVNDQKNKVQTGIVIRNLEIGDPPVRAANKASAPIFVQGSSATIRTPSAPTYTLDAISDIRISGVRYVLSPGKAYSGSPLFLLYYSAGITVEDVTVSGFETVNEHLALVEYCNDCAIAYTGATAEGSRIFGSLNCTLDARTTSTPTAQSGGKAGLTAAGRSLTATVAATLAPGATSITLSAVSTALTVPRGQRIRLTNGKSVVIAKTTTLSSTGTNHIPIERSEVAENAGAAAVIQVICSGLKVKGCFSSWEYGVMLSDVNGALIEANFERNGKYDILLSGARADAIRISRSRFQNGGQKQDGSLMANIHLGTNGDNVSIIGCDFEPTGLPIVNRNIFGSTELSNVTISGNHFGGSTLPSIAIGPQSAAASLLGKISITGNTSASSTTLTDPGTIQGQYVGGLYQGFAPDVPATGYWRAGDSLTNLSPTAGSPKGWRCVAAGTPGTWVSEGNL